MSRPLQPSASGGIPVVPQSLNRYAAAGLGQVGVAEAAAQGGLNGVSVASYVVGFLKSLGQESKYSIFGKNVPATAVTGHKFAGQVSVAFEASRSSLQANRAAIERAGGIFEESISNIRRTTKNGTLGKSSFQADIFKFRASLDGAEDLARSLRSTSSLVQEGFYQARTRIYALDIQPVNGISRIARFSRGQLLGIDVLLGGVFQFYDDLSHPYLTPGQRVGRAIATGVGGGVLSAMGGLAGGALACGPYAPVCIAGGALGGALIWGFGIQPWIFESELFAPPPANLKPLQE